MSIDDAVSKHVLEFEYNLVGDEISSVFGMVMILNFIKQLCSNSTKFKVVTI